MNLVSNWEGSIGLHSGSEVFIECHKGWVKSINELVYPNVSNKSQGTPEAIIKALAEVKKQTGKDAVSFSEVLKQSFKR